MDLEIVKQNEQSGNRSAIHLYYNREMCSWVSYGYSAYSLSKLVRDGEMDSFNGFSSTHMMPYTVINCDAMKSLRRCMSVVSGDNPEHYIVAIDECEVSEDYVGWSEALHRKFEENGGFDTQTHISHLVPKEGYIADGMNSLARNTKRLFDMVSSFVLMILFAPLFAICAIMVYREDGGPVIYKQERIGRFGRPFNILKFRTMRVDAEALGPQLSHGGGEGDPRITKVGRFLRAHHLDELPQLWNVFVGDMAFVGPRPERKFYIDKILQYDKRYVYLYQIRPGVTSYATFYNGYTDTMEKMLRRLEYDLYYLGHRSWVFDIKILVKTFFGIIFGKNF